MNNQISWLYSRNYHKIVNQIYFNKINKYNKLIILLLSIQEES